MDYKIQENYLTVYLPKEVDHYNAEEMRNEADMLIRHNHIKTLIFDFGETEFCDSSGIGVIMGRYRLLSLLGGEVWAVHVGTRMKKILTLSGVLNIMKIYEEERA